MPGGRDRGLRGHPTDLLDRHLAVARRYGAEVVAKVPSDCPLVDPAVIDSVFARFAEGDSDYTSNLHPASFPDGNDAELMSVEVLEIAWREARLDFEREHRFDACGVKRGRGAPPGNQNAKKKWSFRDAFNEAFEKDPTALLDIAKILIKKARSGEMDAIRELMQRIDGRVPYALMGPEGGDIPVRFVVENFEDAPKVEVDV